MHSLTHNIRSSSWLSTFSSIPPCRPDFRLSSSILLLLGSLHHGSPHSCCFRLGIPGYREYNVSFSPDLVCLLFPGPCKLCMEHNHRATPNFHSGTPGPTPQKRERPCTERTHNLTVIITLYPAVERVRVEFPSTALARAIVNWPVPRFQRKRRIF